MIGWRLGSLAVILIVIAGLSVGVVLQLGVNDDTNTDTTTTSSTTTTTTTPPFIPEFIPHPPEYGDIFFTYPDNSTRMNEFMDNVQSGGPPPDGIPAIEDPVYVTAAEDTYLSGTDIVFGLQYRGVTIAYPQRILVWHEIVNENFNGQQISITYCPLTGSTIAFHGSVNGTPATTFGTSGKLVNSNLVMYDRATDSYWPQILSQAIKLPSRGLGLQRIQMFFTTWERWKAVFPNTLVLTTDTGYFRDYERDPYGSYENPNSYYNDGGPFFPVMYEDNSLDDKEVVVGVDVNGSRIAIQKEYMKQEKVYNFELGDDKYVAFYDHYLDVVRTFMSNVDGQEFTYRYADGKVFDDQTDTEWRFDGTSSLGTLIHVSNMDVMWFAWTAYFPDTALVCIGCS
ncbi:MAG: DUF3179 domain-containing protein [Candidatus Thorarchaeota archaeon]|jgi:hypothetical protein